ncbi:MAG: MBL fold metallo-hydrolase [Christensenellales bacterium]
MNLQFLGAAREVTGSSYFLQTGGKNILIDCGMEQGADTYENQQLPVSAAMVDCVVLTHAHIDHAGMLPALYQQGFRGPIYATPATISLCDIMLLDSAHIQEQEAQWRNRKAQRADEQPYLPIYTTLDAEGTLTLFKPVPYEQEAPLFEHVRLRMTDAGHLLGSASASLTIHEEGLTRTLVFSGDIGNLGQPILDDPHYLSGADYVVMESTYGDRLHGPRPDYIRDLTDVLQTTFDRGGNVVIPSFAVGRTQEILYFLREIKEKGLVHGHEGFPVFLDSPLAIKATEVFSTADRSSFDAQMRQMLAAGINPITFPDLKLCVSADESKQINFQQSPCVIISASGMAEAGRIRHHLKHNLWKENATILFVGYQSVGTLGRLLVDGAKEVRLFQESIAVHAQIRLLKAISGHADKDGLLTWARSFSPAPTRFFVCHGEDEVAQSFAKALEAEGKVASVPYSGDTWDLLGDKQIGEGSRKLAGKRADKAAKEPRDAGKVEGDQPLHAAFQGLNALMERSRGFGSDLKMKLAGQINKLLKKWE